MIDQSDLFAQSSRLDRQARAEAMIDRAHPDLYLRTEIPEAQLERAAFVRHHVSEIMKKGKTSASHRTKGKKLLERCEAIGDTGAGEEARAEYEMAERADALAESHILALIERTEIR